MEVLTPDKLKTKFIGRRIIHYSTLPSTMEAAKEAARSGAEEGTLVVADEQTSGRGRLGRVWLSPQGSLAISIILCPTLAQLPQLLMIASLAVVRAIERVSGLRAWIKWPNDVLINGKKVCGILIESELKGDQVNFAVIGIGINVNFNLSAFPEISATATSLSHELKSEVPYLELVNALLMEIEHLYLGAQAGAPIYEEWQEHMETLGKFVQVKVGEIIKQGRAEAVAKDGSLLLRSHNGSLTEIVAGDVTVVKD